MIKKKEHNHDYQIIDLTGPEGNAFFLMGVVKKNAPLIGLDPDKIIELMKAGDYENLITVFDNYLGEYFTLLR